MKQKFTDSRHMNRPYSGYLIAIEGIDGAGKTTQAHHVQDVLQGRKLAVIRTKEPTTGQYGQILRDSANTGRLSLDEEVDVFIKDRQEHVREKLRPALESGKIVISDRYYFSNMAYQGARGANSEEIRRRNEMFAPEPDLLIILDLEPALGLQRIRTRGDRANHFETTGTLKKAREIFLNIKKPYIFKIDATHTVEEVRNLIIREFSRVVAECIAHSNSTAEDKLNETLKLFGAAPIGKV